jgi:hypothetical protein
MYCLGSYCAPCAFYRGVCYKGKCLSYVFKMHPVLSIDVCHKGECSSYVVKVHLVLSMEVCATWGNVRFMYLKCTLYFLWKCVPQGGMFDLCT